MAERYVGCPIRRLEDTRYLLGRGQFIDDLRLPGMVCAHFLRSPHAHARILRIDSKQTRKAPGVLGVWTAQEIGSKVKPMRPLMQSKGYRASDWHPLAKGKVRYVGEAVAVVVATDRYRAEDAAESVSVEYVPLDPVPDVDTSLNAKGNTIHEELESNILFEFEHEGGDVDKAFEGAGVKISRSFKHPRCTGLAIENRGVLAQYDASKKFLTVWSSTQAPDLLRKAVAECLGHPEHRVRVLAPDVGGGFGIKMHVFPEELIVSHLARELRQPVKWIEDRRENLMASLHARDHVLHAEIAARKDGTILALKVRDFCDVGAYSAYPVTAALEPLSCASGLPGPYKIANYYFRSMAVATNKCPVGAYRGVGFALNPFVTEALMDLVAREVRIDPAEIRRRNFISPDEFPFTAASGTVYDSGNYRPSLERALKLANYEGVRRSQQQLRGQNRYVGVGLSSFIEPTGMGQKVYRRRGMVQVPAFDSATIKVDPSGTVRAYLSTPSQGQGQETSFAQLLAEELGFRIEDIAIFLGDTETCPSGNGTFASRSIVSAGSALVLAARRVRQKLLAGAAHLLQVPSGELEIQEGRIFAKACPGEGLSIRELAQEFHSPLHEFPEELSPGLEATHSFSLAGAAVSGGTHVAIVEVDIETGVVNILRYVVVEDCGKIINPTIVDGQIRGGVAQGVGSALYEDLVYDDQGQLLTATLMDYLIPGSTEVPTVEIRHIETLSPLTPNGSKGVGESGTIASPAAINNAIADALTPFGISFTKLPITPQDILDAVRENSQARAGKNTEGLG